MSSFLPPSWQDYLQPDANPGATSNGTANYLKVRFYLYKYTPPIERFTEDKKPSGAPGHATAAYLNKAKIEKENTSLTAKVGENEKVAASLTEIVTAAIKLQGTLTESNTVASGYTTFHQTALNLNKLFKDIKDQYDVPQANGDTQTIKVRTENLGGSGAFPSAYELVSEKVALDNVKTNFAAASVVPSISFGVFNSNITVAIGYVQRVREKYLTSVRGYTKSKEALKSATTTYNKAAKANLYEAFKIQKFKSEMNPMWFTRYDISEFVASYTFNQQLEGNGYSWDVTLADRIVPFDRLNLGNRDAIRRPVYFPLPGDTYSPVPQMASSQIISNLSQHQSDEDADFEADAIRIETAIRLRGIADSAKKARIINKTSFYSVTSILEALKNENNGDISIDSSQDGIYLSDLIQKYDFVTAFVYNHEVPPNLIEEVCIDHDPNFFDKEPEFLYRNTTSVQQIKPIDQRTTPGASAFGLPASVGSSTRNPRFEDLALSLYDIDFNGFVHTISPTVAVERVNTFTISGNGGTMILGATRFIFAPTIFQRSIYDMGETFNTQDFSSLTFEQIFQKDGGNADDIVKFLLQNYYQIVDSIVRSKKEILSVSTNKDQGEIKDKDKTINALNTFAIDMSKIQMLNEYPGGPRLLFLLPVFLYACVMRMRKFNTIGGDINGDVTAAGSLTYVKDPPTKNIFERENLESTGGSLLDTYTAFNGKEKGQFRTYFTNLRKGMDGYNPAMKTAWEVIKDIRDISYLEFFETPGGRMIFRMPQYNNTTVIGGIDIKNNGRPGEMVTSNDIKVISTKYLDTANGMITRQQLAYGVDILGQLIPQLTYFYSNGKLLGQYGLMTSNSKMNPNARPRRSSTSEEQNFLKGMFEYCRFFLEYSNMKIKTGRIKALGDPIMRVGRTFFDLENQKFGYVTGVTKSLTVGQSYTMDLTVIGVRDAVVAAGDPDAIDSISVKRIPELRDIITKYNGTFLTEPEPARITGSSPKTPPSKAWARQMASAITKQATYYSGNSKSYTNKNWLDPRDVRKMYESAKSYVRDFLFKVNPGPTAIP